jgi:uncharacterized membrane protein
MRIIAQDGNLDLPYNNIMVYRERNKIIVSAVNNLNIREVIAEYDTDEKAEKAIKMLREEYLYLKRCEIKGDYVQMPPAYFQFPQDSEV